MSHKRFIFAAAVFAVSALVVIMFVKSRTPDGSDRQHRSQAANAPQLLPPGAENSQDATGAKTSPPVPTIDRLKEIATQLTAGTDPETSRRLLAELRAFLNARPRAAVSGDVPGFSQRGR